MPWESYEHGHTLVEMTRDFLDTHRAHSELRRVSTITQSVRSLACDQKQIRNIPAASARFQENLAAIKADMEMPQATADEIHAACYHAVAQLRNSEACCRKSADLFGVGHAAAILPGSPQPLVHLGGELAKIFSVLDFSEAGSCYAETRTA